MGNGYPGIRPPNSPPRYPVLAPESTISSPTSLQVLAATNPYWETEKGGETTLSTLKRADPQLATIVDYLEKGVLPDDTRRAVNFP